MLAATVRGSRRPVAGLLALPRRMPRGAGDRSASTGASPASPAPDPAVRTPLLAPAADGVLRPAGPRVAARAACGLAHPALKGGIALSVVDVSTGAPVLEVRGSREVVPASTAKVVTALAALTVLPSDRRCHDKRRRGHRGPTSSSSGVATRPCAGRGRRAPRARLTDLAAQVKQSGHQVGRVLVDDTLFTGPRIGPRLEARLRHRRGRLAGERARAVRQRVTDPALEAGRVLATLLGVPTSTVVPWSGGGRGGDPGDVSSAVVPDLVEQMLTTSDNDLAEALGRHIALAAQQPATSSAPRRRHRRPWARCSRGSGSAGRGVPP